MTIRRRTVIERTLSKIQGHIAWYTTAPPRITSDLTKFWLFEGENQNVYFLESHGLEYEILVKSN